MPHIVTRSVHGHRDGHVGLIDNMPGEEGGEERVGGKGQGETDPSASAQVACTNPRPLNPKTLSLACADLSIYRYPRRLHAGCVLC